VEVGASGGYDGYDRYDRYDSYEVARWIVARDFFRKTKRR